MGWLQDILQEVPLSSVLRERLALAEDRFQQAEEKIATLDRQLEGALADNKALRERLAKYESAEEATSASNEVDETTSRVLGYLLDAQGDDRDVGIMSQRLGMKRSMVQYCLDELGARDFAHLSGGNYVSGHVYWTLTPAGRKFAIQKGLGA